MSFALKGGWKCCGQGFLEPSPVLPQEQQLSCCWCCVRQLCRAYLLRGGEWTIFSSPDPSQLLASVFRPGVDMELLAL